MGREKEKRILTLGNFADCVTADPHIDDYSFSRRLQRGPYEPLFELRKDEDGNILVTPLLAKRYKISENGTVYTFDLQRGVKFSDGTPFDAEAVKYNLERIIALDNTPADDLEYVKDIQIIDSYTIRLQLAYPFRYFMHHITYPLMVSPTAAQDHEVDRDWGQNWLVTHTVGTGPYLLEEWKPGEYWKLVRNDRYWRGWKGKHVDEVVGLIVPEEATRVELLRQGKIDFTRVNDISALQDLQNSSGTKVYEVRDTAAYMVVQMKVRGYLIDPRVRRALLYVFPYETFWSDVVGGHGRATNGPMSDTLFGWNSNLPMLRQDLDRARELLAEAGYSEGFDNPLTLYTFTPFLPWWADLAVVLQESLAKVGIELHVVDIKSGDAFLSATLNPDISQGPDLYVWGTGARTESPSRYLGLWISDNTPPGRNGGFYRNDHYDRLYKRAVQTTDPRQQARLYEEMQEVLMEDPPALYIGEYFYYWGLRKSIRGFVSVLAEDRIAGGWYDVHKE